MLRKLHIFTQKTNLSLKSFQAEGGELNCYRSKSKDTELVQLCEQCVRKYQSSGTLQKLGLGHFRFSYYYLVFSQHFGNY